MANVTIGMTLNDL